MARSSQLIKSKFLLLTDKAKKRLLISLALFAAALSYWSYQMYAIDTARMLNTDALARIDATTEKYSFGIMGDSRNSVKVFENGIAGLNSDGVFFSVNLGDFIFTSSPHRYKFFIDHASKLNHPLLIAPGNHDVGGGPTGHSDYEKYIGKAQFAFTVGRARFLMLDNSNGLVTDEQLAWLRGELEKIVPGDPVFLFAHYPLYDPRVEKGTTGQSMSDPGQAAALSSLMDEFNVTAAFTSHIHAYFDGLWGKTPFIITGGGGAHLGKPDDPASAFFHYVVVHVDGREVSWEIKKLSPPKNSPLDNGHYEWLIFKEGWLHYVLLLGCGLYVARAWLQYKKASSLSDNESPAAKPVD